jgi:hypothetical protein
MAHGLKILAYLVPLSGLSWITCARMVEQQAIARSHQ